ncbi:hypothetical protein SCUCBS95973_004097 [Sporothrix curviconia]|uniref:Alcohol dehydrogenase-like C-terminal domain-containing protein n=1 Tax=Sporothrix curviconia TaxID=1260050 RepID=A0ABP0BKU3_9PEZI
MMASSQSLQTKAFVVDHVGGPFTLKNVILDGIRGDEILDIVVKDVGMPVGGFPVVLGHEGLGIVRQVGTDVVDKSLRLGDTTNTSPISLLDGQAVHGQFFGQSSLSRLAVATEKSVVKIDARPEDLAYLAPLACGYLTGASTVLNVLAPRRTECIAVLGMGAVGLAAVMAAKSLGVEHILAVDIVDAKLATATEVGASYAINPRAFANLNDGIRSVFPSGEDKIVDATGIIAVLNDAARALAHGGTLALVGVPPPNAQLQVDALDLLLSCKKIVGVIEGLCSPQETIPRQVKLYYEGKFPVHKLATLYAVEEMEKAIEDFKNGKVIKPILSWGSVDQS